MTTAEEYERALTPQQLANRERAKAFARRIEAAGVFSHDPLAGEKQAGPVGRVVDDSAGDDGPDDGPAAHPSS